MSASTRWAALLGATVAVLFAAGCATTPEQTAVRSNARLQLLQTALIARGDPDSLAASALFAVLLSQAGNRKPYNLESTTVALDLAARAAAAAPNRPDLVLAQLQFCQAVPACDPDAAQAHLRELDPENGIGRTYALERADRANDAAAMRQARAALARAQRVTSYWNQSVSHLTAAAAGQAGFDASEAMITVIGIEAAYAVPLAPVSKACSAQEIQQPEVLAQCRQIAAAFRRADTELFESFGSNLGARFWPEGSAERAEIAAERRVLHYRRELMTRYNAKLNSPAAARALATLFAQYPTEQDAFRALYIRFGLRPDPPANWIDRTQDDTAASPVVGVHRVGGNVYMLDTDTSKFEGGNVAVLVGSEGLLLVDTNSGSHTSAIVAALKRLSDKPVRYVINTHCHGDHTGGNGVFQRAGATVIAHSNVRKRIEQDKCDKIEKGLPTITFDSELTLHFDGEEVSAIKIPTSHTDGDAIVYFKKANIVHTGDAFVSINLPFRSKYAGGDILGLADALREIVRRVPEDAKVIPGHGPQATISDVRRAIRILDEMKDAVAVQVRQGKTLDELTKMKLLSPWKGALGAGDDEYYLRDFYDALTGVPLEPQFRLN